MISARDAAVAQSAIDTSDAGEGADDSGYGAVIFLGFAAAVLAVSFMVCALALVGSWWMLGVAMGVHVGVTAAVIWMIADAFTTSDEPDESEPEPIAAATPTRPAMRVRPTLAAHH